MRRRHRIRGFLLFFLLLVGAATAALSAQAETAVTQAELADFSKRSYCLRYTKLAIAAQRRNLGERCGFKGDRWSAIVRDHTRWCLDAPVDRSRAATAIRQKAILSCIARTKTGYCGQYLRTATVAFFRNDEDRCGLTGNHWRMRGAALKDWCLRVPRRQSTNAARMRAQDLAACAKGRRKGG